MKVARNGPCPCGHPAKFKKCCERLHRGAPAASPAELMRSRYSAYASEAVRYIIDTTHPDGPHHEDDVRRWTQSIEAFCRGTEFVKLEVLDSGDLPDGDAWVTFRANLTQSGQDASFVERSVFRKHQGTWKYLSGEPEPVSP